MDTNSYLKERNQPLLTFINGFVNFDYRNQSNKQLLLAIAIVVEMVYFICNLNLVLPHCFLINLLQSFVSGSKTV